MHWVFQLVLGWCVGDEVRIESGVQVECKFGINSELFAFFFHLCEVVEFSPTGPNFDKEALRRGENNPNISELISYVIIMDLLKGRRGAAVNVAAYVGTNHNLSGFEPYFLDPPIEGTQMESVGAQDCKMYVFGTTVVGLESAGLSIPR